MFEIKYQTHNAFWNTIACKDEEECNRVYEGLKALHHVTKIEKREIDSDVLNGMEAGR